MFTRKIFPIILMLSFIAALVVFIFLLKPDEPQANLEPQKYSRAQAQPIEQLEPKQDQQVKDALLVEKPKEEITLAPLSLSFGLEAVKQGKSSILSVILTSGDLNAQLDELFALSEQGEAWADFAIGQVSEMCTYLYETPESQLIQIFTADSRSLRPDQQAQMSEMLPVVIDASQRCKTINADKMEQIGNSRKWIEKAAEANQASAFVTRGFALISQRMRNEVEFDPNYSSEESENRYSEIRIKAKAEFHKTMREHFSSGRVNPETIMSMADHLNLFYDDKHPLKSKEAWMLLACEQGYEKGCNRDSKMMNLYCMFESTCQTGGDFQQGIVWQQGQFQYDEYRRTADELREIFANKDWDKLGF